MAVWGLSIVRVLLFSCFWPTTLHTEDCGQQVLNSSCSDIVTPQLFRFQKSFKNHCTLLQKKRYDRAWQDPLTGSAYKPIFANTKKRNWTLCLDCVSENSVCGSISPWYAVLQSLQANITYVWQIAAETTGKTTLYFSWMCSWKQPLGIVKCSNQQHGHSTEIITVELSTWH